MMQKRGCIKQHNKGNGRRAGNNIGTRAGRTVGLHACMHGLLHTQFSAISFSVGLIYYKLCACWFKDDCMHYNNLLLGKP